MLITALRQTSPGRVTVCLEDASEIKSTLNVVTDLRLYHGRDISDSLLESLRSQSAMALMRDKALELLALRPMSCKELCDKLVQKGYDRDAAYSCTQWLSENGLIDDASYAASVARHYFGKGYGAGRVRAELARRGIARELADETLDSSSADDGKLLRYIETHLHDGNDRDEVRKLSASLYRRGFSWDEIRRALAKYNAYTEDD